jgi:hypothetical protein
MRNAYVILFAAALALSFCSQEKKKETPSLAEKNFQQANEAKVSRAAGEESAAPLKIKAVLLSPETPTVADDVTVAVEMADPATEGASLRYQWFVNGRELDGGDLEKLDKSRIRKGDWIHCRAQATFEQADSDWAQSDTIRVLNTLPELRLGPVGAVRVPGDFQYQAAAGDADNDELTFALVAPVDQGIVLDAKSGLLTWTLTAEAVKALGDKVEIKLAVSDGEGKVEGTIALNFTSTTKKSELP